MVTWLGLTGCERDCSMGNSPIALGTIQVLIKYLDTSVPKQLDHSQ